MNNEEISNEILLLFSTFGDEDYDGEPVSQTSHMIQCGMQAIKQGEDDELIIGAFLHDIGHLLRHKKKQKQWALMAW